MAEPAFPDQARAVIIGGGVMGCSVAYHLTKLGWRDVMLLEQGRLSCGTTWHAAGLVGQLRAHQNMTRLVQYSAQLYAQLEEETGQATGWKQCGSVLVARTPERVTLFKRIASSAKAQGIDCELISIEEAADKYPVMRTDDLVGALWLPLDGKVNPADITQALGQRRAHGRRAHLRADARHRDPSQGWRGDRRRHQPRRHQSRGRRQLRRAMGEAGRPHVRRDRAAAFRRAHVHRHRQDRRRASGSSGAARSGRLHLRQGRSRRAVDGRLRAACQALGDGRHSGEFRIRNAAGRLGPVPDPDGECADPASGAGNRRDQDLHERAGKLHARQQFHPGRSAGTEEFLRRRGFQFDRHRLGRRRRAARSPNGSCKASRRSISGRSISAASPNSTTTTPSCTTA